MFFRLLLAAFFYFFQIGALPTVVPDPIPCVEKLQTNFFLENLVNQGLSLYDVRQELWAPIRVVLQQKSLEVPDRMKRQTAFMVPNPLEYPMQRGAVAKILKAVLSDVFRETIEQVDPASKLYANAIFEYIFAARLPAFVDCFGPEAKTL